MSKQEKDDKEGFDFTSYDGKNGKSAPGDKKAVDSNSNGSAAKQENIQNPDTVISNSSSNVDPSTVNNEDTAIGKTEDNLPRTDAKSENNDSHKMVENKTDEMMDQSTMDSSCDKIILEHANEGQEKKIEVKEPSVVKEIESHEVKENTQPIIIKEDPQKKKIYLQDADDYLLHLKVCKFS